MSDGVQSFVDFFKFQCDRITLQETGLRLKPSRSLLRYLTMVSPALFVTHCADEESQIGQPSSSPLRLDFAPFLLGNDGAIAVLRSLSQFPTLPTTPLRVALLDFTQCGLSTSAVRELCALLHSGRCVALQTIVLDRNEYLAVEAGQLLLRAIGHTGPLGDGMKGGSNKMAVPPTEGLLGFRDLCPALHTISLVGTNVPPHFVRRIEDHLKPPSQE